MKPIRPLRPIMPSKPKPTVSLCVIFRDNKDTIIPLLNSVLEQFDEYVFTDTGSTDGTRDIVQKWLKGNHLNGKITDFVWCDDFAKARQANFEAASGRWRMFLDSDDVLQTKVPISQLVLGVEKQHPDVQGCFIHYDYDKLEELPSMRLVKWVKGWRWEDAIHERLVAKPGNPLPPDGMVPVNPKDVVVIHKRKSAEEKQHALIRNAAIARREYVETTDVEYKARLARTLAMEHKLNNDMDKAEPFLEEVARVYPNHPEGRQAMADLSRLHAQRGNLQTALDFAKRAGPSYEAIVHHQMGDHKRCIHAGTKASVAGQQATHEGFLFEQVFAPLAMADSALHLGYHPSAVERGMNTIRSDLRNQEHIKWASRGIRTHIDRITILIPTTPQPFDGSSASTEGMLGGSEEAVVYLTRELARQGRNVRVFGVLPPLSLPGFDEHGVEWRPFSEFKLHDEHGCLVVWRSVGLLFELLMHVQALQRAAEAGDEKAIVPTGIMRGSLWLHDMSLGVNNKAEAERICCGVREVIVLSDHHRRCIERGLPENHKVNFIKLANPVVTEDFKDLDWSKRDPNRVVYSSCPSRGLVPLLEMWPKIKAACPEAYLDIYYDWSMLKQFQPEAYARVDAAYQAVRHLDVHHHGGVGHAELHQALAGANVWAYSHFENTDVETFCISSVKATLAGAEVITAKSGALPEVVPDATFCTRETYADAVIEAIRTPLDDDDRRVAALKIAARFDVKVVAEQFSKVWTSKTLVAPSQAATTTEQPKEAAE